jgi:Leucine-rich repeat (LRR) protein
MTAASIKSNTAPQGGIKEKELRVESFKMMVNLESLNLGANRLEQLPPDLWKVPHLVELNLKNNLVREISNDIERLKNSLQELHLDGNKLEELPSCLHTFLQLSSLTVSDNELLALPALPPCLTTLLARNNQIQSLPASFFSLTSLEELDVRGNEAFAAETPSYLLKNAEEIQGRFQGTKHRETPHVSSSQLVTLNMLYERAQST